MVSKRNALYIIHLYVCECECVCAHFFSLWHFVFFAHAARFVGCLKSTEVSLYYQALIELDRIFVGCLMCLCLGLCSQYKRTNERTKQPEVSKTSIQTSFILWADITLLSICFVSILSLALFFFRFHRRLLLFVLFFNFYFCILILSPIHSTLWPCTPFFFVFKLLTYMYILTRSCFYT